MTTYKIIAAKEENLINKLFIETKEDNLINDEPFAGSWTENHNEYETGLVDLYVKDLELMSDTELIDLLNEFVVKDEEKEGYYNKDYDILIADDITIMRIDINPGCYLIRQIWNDENGNQAITYNLLEKRDVITEKKFLTELLFFDIFEFYQTDIKCKFCSDKIIRIKTEYRQDLDICLTCLKKLRDKLNK